MDNKVVEKFYSELKPGLAKTFFQVIKNMDPSGKNEDLRVEFFVALTVLITELVGDAFDLHENEEVFLSKAILIVIRDSVEKALKAQHKAKGQN